ncbi:MFS transporter [Streptomyces sp. NBC_01716]|uniref:MFS transporter n=1 Tax=Streptomyces sp. NBC_01716 TaxID=2975917 RepID=UPI002E34C8AF|nr:MFS transporter [Streptomyces sp. NBC_01716]
MTDKVQANRVAVASLVGTTLEYFEFFSYTVASVLVFPDLMFPDFLPATAMLLSLASTGVAFLARPFGALAFGHFGDRYGRRPMLLLSLVMMGTATTLIGLLPGHSTWSLAPILLVVLRLVQGLAVAGENAGSSLLAIEHAPAGRSGLFSGFTGTGSAIGILLANGTFFALSSSLSDEQFMSWGWRVPFLASAVLVLFGLWVRLSVPETPVYQSAGRPSRVPLWTIVRRVPRPTLLMVGAMVFGNVFYYTVQTFVVAHGTALGVSRSTMLAATTIAALLQAIANLAWC